MTDSSTLLAPTEDLKRRYRAENRFRKLGLYAILASLAFVVFLFATIIVDGVSAFRQTYIELDVDFKQEVFTGENLATADFPGLVKASMRSMFPDVKKRRDKKQLYKMISPAAAYLLQDMVEENPRIIGTQQKVWVLADDDVDMVRCPQRLPRTGSLRNGLWRGRPRCCTGVDPPDQTRQRRSCAGTRVPLER